MFHFLYKNRPHTSIQVLLDSRFLQYPYLRFISTSTNSPSTTQSYLINSCGLSPETALSASQKIHLKPTHNPNSVLDLLKHHGFSKTEITLTISKWPSILLSDSDKTLKPKLEFFQSLGFSGLNIPKLISSDPTFLKGGLKNRLIPSLEYLKDFLVTDDNVCTAINKCTWLLKHNLEKYIGPNVATLRSSGVPDSNILKLFFRNPSRLLSNTGSLSDVVHLVKKMGFDPLTSSFVRVVEVLAGMTNVKWESKLALYQELGWSKEETLELLRKQPNCLMISEKKIRLGVNFLTNVLKWKPCDISSEPLLLLYSLEKRVIPRCSVLGVLNSAGVLKKLSLKSALHISEKAFLEKYVTRYKDRVPDVVKAYQGKLVFEGFGKVGLFKEL